MAIGKPVALDASADERETLGFISITRISPVSASATSARPPDAFDFRTMASTRCSTISWMTMSMERRTDSPSSPSR